MTIVVFKNNNNDIIIIIIIIIIIDVKYKLNNSYIWTAVIDQSEEWSWQ